MGFDIGIIILIFTFREGNPRKENTYMHIWQEITTTVSGLHIGAYISENCKLIAIEKNNNAINC